MELKKLAEPFAPEDIEWRVQQSGGFDKKPWAMVLAYVTNRAVMERLDDVCSPENWCNEFKDAPDGGVMCGISIKAPNQSGPVEWVTKWDGAENTNIEAVKGGLSGAMKRAAVQWGIGRYLYNLESNFVSLRTKETVPEGENWNSMWVKEKNQRYYWKAPQLPEWALPKEKKDEE